LQNNQTIQNKEQHQFFSNSYNQINNNIFQIKVINFKEASSKNFDENLIRITDVTDGCLYRSLLQTN
jgi:hypothetical protein